MTPPLTENFRSAPKWRTPLGMGVVVCAVATLASYLAPESIASLCVALSFLGPTYFLCLRRAQKESPAYFGLELGGLFEPAPLNLRRLQSSLVVSSAWALLAAALIFPIFALAFPLYYNTHTSFSFEYALRGLVQGSSWFDVLAGQLLVVALPEEVFFRGYLQTRLNESFPQRATLFGFVLSPSIVLTSALFALGHYATIPYAPRLAVFFPSLVFGVLRERTGSVGPSTLFHALSNLFSAALLAGYGFV